jgi:hypothetical protein
MVLSPLGLRSQLYLGGSVVRINRSIALMTTPSNNTGAVKAKLDRLVADASDQIRIEYTMLLPRFDAIELCYFLSNQAAI